MTPVRTDVQRQWDNPPVTMASQSENSTSSPDVPASPSEPSRARGRSTSTTSHNYSRNGSRSPGKGRARYSPYPALPREHQFGRTRLNNRTDSLGAELPWAISTTPRQTSPELSVPDGLSDDAVSFIKDQIHLQKVCPNGAHSGVHCTRPEDRRKETTDPSPPIHPGDAADLRRAEGEVPPRAGGLCASAWDRFRIDHTSLAEGRASRTAPVDQSTSRCPLARVV